MKKGHERYRPTSLALQMINHVIEGNLITTAHSENQPTLTAKGRFEDDKPDGELTFPAIWRYAFKNGNERGLVLFNLDPSDPQVAQLKFDGKVAGAAAQAYTLTGDSINRQQRG